MPSLKAYTCCFIGHSDIPFGEDQKIYTRARYPLQEMIWDGVKYFGVGGNRGFDRIMMDFLLRQRDYYKKQVRIISVLPYPDYMADWPEEEREKQQQYLKRCDKVTYAAEHDYPGAELDRGRKLIDGSAYCVCYCHRTDETTAALVRYAMESGLKVINACSWDLRQLGVRKDWTLLREQKNRMRT